MFRKLLRLLFARKVRTDAPATVQTETPERHPTEIEKLIERYPLEAAADSRYIKLLKDRRAMRTYAVNAIDEHGSEDPCRY